MVEIVLLTVCILPLIITANLAEAHQRLSPFLAVLTFGIVKFSGLWLLFAQVVKRLSWSTGVGFDAQKPVHRTAAFLMILGFLNFGFTILINESTSEDAPVALAEALPELLGAGALHLAAACLGVGWLMRRTVADLLERLDLRRPSLKEAGISIVVGGGLWLMTTALVAIWERSVPAEVFLRQTAEAQRYFAAFSGSVITALLLAIIPAVSEEVFYRGALQPIFGVLLSSLFFTVTHTQYGLTPATLILFVVSLGFAWLRSRYHTSAAILAHAVFNFLPYLAGS